MHPIFLKLGPITIHTYGVLLAVGALSGILLVGRLAKKSDLDPDQVQNLLIWCLLAGLIGSRLAFVFIEWPAFKSHLLRIFQIWDGGLVFYGGIAGGLPMGLFLARRWGIPLWPLLDCAAPGLALAQFFGRLGCFSAGCCYGKPHDGACSVIFSSPEALAPRGVALYPTQLFIAGEMLIILAFFYWLWPRRRFAGQVFLFYGLLHGVARVVIEQFRGDFRGEELIAGLTPTGLFALGLALFCGLALFVKWSKAKNL